MSIPFICRTATTQDAAASPSVAVSAAAVAGLLALVMTAEREVGVDFVRYLIERLERSGANVPTREACDSLSLLMT
jgi:hypothetical protein